MFKSQTHWWLLAVVFSLANCYAQNRPESSERYDGVSSNQTVEEAHAVIRALQEKLTTQQKQIDQLVSDIRKQQEILAGILDSQAGTDIRAKERRPVSLGEVASTTAMIPNPLPLAKLSPLPLRQETRPSEESSPLQFKIGSATIMPVGFMDFTAVMRSTNAGTGIGTSFGNVPFHNTVAGKLSETRLSAQNSRLGIRVDTKAANANVLGYLEADFLGLNPVNVAVTSNSSSLRMRLYWVDVRKGKYEILGGQSWGMLTPNRKGLSPIPADLFYSQNIDVNYQLGLTWSRNPQFRLIYHPTPNLALGISLENPEQYVGGSGGVGGAVGEGAVTLPSSLASAYAAELNNGTTFLEVPALHPDIVAKIAYDTASSSGKEFHFELAGLERTFKVYNPIANRKFTANGFGASANFNWEMLKNFRIVSNNFWSSGGGREIFGVAPDLVVRGDGGISPVHASSTVSGFELTTGRSQFAIYYGGVYIQRNTAVDPANGRLIGYGYTGSPNSHDRSIQEVTFDWNRTIWKDPKFGALNFMMQYSYLIRNPWFTALSQPKYADVNMVFLNLRYTLPGLPPAIK